MKKTQRLLAALLCTSVILASSPAMAQNSAPPVVEETEDDPHLLGKALSLGGLGLVHTAVYIWSYFAWYKGRTTTDHLVFKDEGFFGLDTYAGGADKFGHMWSNYALNRITAELLMGGGWSPGPASAISTSTTFAFFIAIELKDGVHKGFGFSWGDMLFNSMGEVLAVLMINYPELDDMIDFKVEYNPTDLYLEKLYNDGVVDAAEDYTGQTFVLSYHLATIDALRQSDRWSWLRYFDATLSYRAGNFLPPPKDPSILREQDLFIGFAINLQEIIDQTFYPQPVAQQKYAGALHHTLSFIPEIYGVPYTNIRLAGFYRQSTPDLFGLKFDLDLIQE